MSLTGNINARFNSAAKKLRGLTSLENLSASSVSAPLPVGSFAANVVFQDTTYSTYTLPTQDNNFQIVPNTTAPCTFVSLTPAIHTVDSSGNCYRVSDGLSQTLVSNGRETILVSQQITRTVTPTNYLQISFAANSLRNHVDGLIKGYMAAGGTPSDATRKIWSSFNTTTDGLTFSGTRNSGRWAPSLSFAASSACCRYTGIDQQRYPVHLITPQHALMANHVTVPGGPIRFMRDDGSIVSVTPSASIAYGDRTIILLSAPVTGVTPYPLLPLNFNKWMPAGTPSYTNGAKGPCLNIAGNSLSTGGVAKLRVLMTQWSSSFPATGCLPIDTTNDYEVQFWPWSSADGGITSGDSSSGIYLPMVIGGTTYLPLLSSISSGGGLYYYEQVAQWVLDVNAIGGTVGAAAQAAGYAPTLVPLASSTFTTYA